MLGKLLLAFIVLPIVELYLLLWLAERTSATWTIGVIIVTGVVGTLLARAEGLRAYRRFREASALGRLPTNEIQEGLLIAAAAALLMTPGLITDTFGLLLLVPVTRRKILQFLKRRIFSSFRVTVIQGGFQPGAAHDPRGTEFDEEFENDLYRSSNRHPKETIVAEKWRRIEPRDETQG